MAQSMHLEAITCETGNGRSIFPKPVGFEKDLKRASVKSGSITVFAQISGALITLCSTAVLARLLTPADYGIVAMVLSLTAFARLFQDMGLSTSTIQQETITHGQTSNLFWINAAVGVLLFFLVSACAPLLASFYHEPALIWVTIVSASTFLIGGCGVQHTALLKRSMQFRSLALRQVFASLVGAVVSIVAAYKGLGYWSLVIGTLAGSLTGVLLVWFASGWAPGTPARGQGVRKSLLFGANITGFEFVNFFARNLDNLLIGRFWGAEALGLYSKAYSLLMLPINNLRNPLNAVAFPALSRLQGANERYRRYYRNYIAILAAVSMPVVGFLFVCSEHVINVILGSQWVVASDVFSYLALASFIQPVASTRGLVLMSMGKGRRYFMWGLWNAVAVSTAFAIGVQWGATGVALAYAAANYLLLIPSLTYCFRGSPISLSDFFQAVAKPGLCSVIAAGVTMGAIAMLPEWQSFKILIFGLLCYGVTFLACFGSSPDGRRQLREYASYRKFLSIRT